MKKFLILSVIAALVLAIALPALAAADDTPLDRFKQKMESKKAYVDELVKSGRLSEDQGKVWKEHFDYMYQFHEKNGFLGTGGKAGKMGCGSCPGKGLGPGQAGQAQNTQ